jgi:hypothetical protein
MSSTSEILLFFKTYQPGPEPIRISSCETIVDQSLFLGSTLARLRRYPPGHVIHDSEILRLREFYQSVSSTLKGVSPTTRGKVSVTPSRNNLSVTKVNNNDSISFVCLNCNKRFVPERSTARYCSDGCRVAYNRKRKKALQITEY